jgi:hypothetical protein
MKPRTLLAIAVAGAFTCSSGAYAASAWNGHEVEEVAIATPAEVGEVALIVPADVEEVAIIAPADAVELAFVEPDSATGASSDASGYGTVAFDSSMSESQGAEVVVYTPAAAQIVEAFGEATPLLSEHYLVPAPLSAHAGAEPFVLAIGPTSEDIALLDSLKQDFYVFTPAYDDA